MRVMDFFIAAKANMVFRRRLIFRKERRTMENDLFEKMPVPKAYMKLAFPVVLSMMVSLVYNMVDTYFIADRSEGARCGSITRSPGIHDDDRIR